MIGYTHTSYEIHKDGYIPIFPAVCLIRSQYGLALNQKPWI